MLSINTNLNALTSQVNKQKSQSAVDQVITRLSSGLRINSAKDDAAGLAIANRMEVNLRADAQISRGINDGIGLMQTAEGGLDEINHLIHRSRELAIQSANGTLSDSDRASINGEFTQIKEEIDRIARSTEIFGKYPLAQLRDNPPEPEKIGDTPSITETFPAQNTSYTFSSGVVPLAYIPTGATNIRIDIHDISWNDDIQLFTTDGEHLVGTPINNTNNTWSKWGVVDAESFNEKVINSKNGFDNNAEYNDGSLTTNTDEDTDEVTKEFEDIKIKYSGDRNGLNHSGSTREHTEYIEIDKTSQNLVVV